MKAKELLEAGELGAAIEGLGAELRSRPTDLRRRIFLFELLCFAGDLGRAGRQLDAIEHQESAPAPGGISAVPVYRGLLGAEADRMALFAEGRRPRFMLEPTPAVERHLEALEWLRQGDPDRARTTLDRADGAEADPIRGLAGESAFEGFRDADDVLAPVLEVFAPAGYFWVPWDQVQYLEVVPPKSLRDLLWAPAKLATFDGQLGEVHVPLLYPGSGASADDPVRLGRKTDWSDAGAGIVRGLGGKLFLAGDDARTLLELGHLQFQPPAIAEGTGSATSPDAGPEDSEGPENP